MGVSRSALTVASLSLLLGAPPGLAALASEQIHGLIISPDPIRATGDVKIPPTAALDATWTQRGARTTYVSHGPGTLVVDEWRWTGTLPDRDPSAKDQIPHAVQSTREERINAGQAIVEPGAANAWRLVSEAGASKPGFTSLSECHIRPRMTDLRIRPTLALPRPVLDVHCAMGRVEVLTETSSSLALFDAKVRFGDLVVEAGLFSHLQGDAKAAAYENILRIVTIRPDPGSSIASQDLRDIRFSAASMHWTGMMYVPPFDGSIRWGDRTVPGSTQQSYDGAFLVVGQSVQPGGPAVELLGIASEPSAHTSPHGLLGPATISVAAAVTLLASILLFLSKNQAIAGVKHLIALAGFTRVTRNFALENPKRRALMDFIEANPGARLTEAQRALGVQRSTLLHHIGILEDVRLLVVHRHGGRLFLSSEPGATQDLAVKEFVSRALVSRILAVVAGCGSCTQAEIAARVGSSQQATSRILRRLEALGRLRRIRIAHGTSYQLLDAAAGAGSPAGKPAAWSAAPS